MDTEYRDTEKEVLLQHIEMLQRENSELREQRIIDRLDMRREIEDLQRRVEGLQVPTTSQSVGMSQFPSSIKKEEGYENPPCRTPAAKVDENQFFNLIESPPKRSDFKPATKVKAATYDGSNSWLDYKAHFETCADINNWSYAERGLFLAVSLRGQAQGVMGILCTKSKDYDALV